MTTGFPHSNNTDNKTPSRGFWGRRAASDDIEEQPFESEAGDDAEAEAIDDTELDSTSDMRPLGRSRTSAAARASIGASQTVESKRTDSDTTDDGTPSWMLLSKTMDDAGLDADAVAADEIGSTAEMPRIASSDVVVRGPRVVTEDEQSTQESDFWNDDAQDADAYPYAQEDAFAKDAGASLTDDADDADDTGETDPLAWDDAANEPVSTVDTANPYASSYEPPAMPDLDEPPGFTGGYQFETKEEPYTPSYDGFDVQRDVYGQGGGVNQLERGDTGYLGASSVYDEAEALGKGDKKKRLRMILIIVGVVLLLGIGYGVGVNHYSDKLLPNTRINGLNVGGRTVADATKALEEQTAAYTCDVSVDNFSTSVSGSDIKIERTEDTMAQDAMNSQSAFAWPIALLFAPNRQVEANVAFDENTLNTKLTEAVDKYNQETLPTDKASIDYNEETGLFEVSGTTEGTAVDSVAVFEAAKKDVQAFNEKSEPSADTATHKATVADIPSYAKTAKNANAVRTTDIPILVNGEEVISSPAVQNAEWVKVGAGPSVTVDEEAVRFWAEYNVADLVYHEDDWSSYYLDIAKFVQEFSQRLATGVVDGYEAPTYDELKTEGESREKAYAKGGWDNSLGRYIDVDLESQFARLFDEGGNVIWESAFVSGDMYEGRSTVTGVFEIYSMQTNTTLVGMDYNGDGEPDYESFVNYWMPFYGGYGLHDATWRSTFGGEQYYYNGSHGCVNLPYTKAEQLYGITHVGEKVNVHW